MVRDLKDAIQICYSEHMYDNDKTGQPFVGHPLRVMARCVYRGFPDFVIEAAALHDVVEDTGWTVAELLEYGFSEETVAIVDAVSRRSEDGETYKEYINRVKASGHWAIALKVQDILDNTEPKRIFSASLVRDRYIPALITLGYPLVAAEVEQKVKEFEDAQSNLAG